MILQWYWWVMIGVVAIVVITFFGRCYLGKTGAGGMRPIIEWKNRRIGLHHWIPGALLVVMYFVSLLPETARFWGLIVVGLILIISDLLHHCLLKLIYGDWDPADPNPIRKRS